MHISTIPKSPPKIIRENTYTDSKREKRVSFYCGFFAESEGLFFETNFVCEKENPQTRLTQKIQDAQASRVRSVFTKRTEVL